MTTDSDTSRKVNRSIELANGSMFYLADGATCPQCGVILRAIDAEPLLPGVRLLCRNNHFVFSFEPAR